MICPPRTAVRLRQSLGLRASINPRPASPISEAKLTTYNARIAYSGSKSGFGRVCTRRPRFASKLLRPTWRNSKARIASCRAICSAANRNRRGGLTASTIWTIPRWSNRGVSGGNSRTVRDRNDAITAICRFVRSGWRLKNPNAGVRAAAPRRRRAARRTRNRSKSKPRCIGG